MLKGRSSPPLVSVITVSYNALEELMAVVDSVLTLNQGEIESASLTEAYTTP